MVHLRVLNRAEVLRADFSKSLKLLAEVCGAESFSRDSDDSANSMKSMTYMLKCC